MCGSLTINKGPQKGLATSHSGKQHGYSLPTRVHRLRTKSAAQNVPRVLNRLAEIQPHYPSEEPTLQPPNKLSNKPPPVPPKSSATAPLAGVSFSIRPSLLCSPAPAPWWCFGLASLCFCLVLTRTRVNPFSLSSTLAHQPLPSFLPLITYGSRSKILHPAYNKPRSTLLQNEDGTPGLG